MAASGANGELFAWGANSYGQLCGGHKEDLFNPTKVVPPTPPNAVRFIGGGGGHTAMLTEDGELWTCGWNNKGQLGLGNRDDKAVLCKVPGLPRISQVACGWNHTLAMTESGELYSWGSNAFGQLGAGNIGGTSLLPSPCEAFKGQQVISLASGLRHSIVTLVDGSVWAWGMNKKGQLGLGDMTDKISPTPKRVTSLDEVAVIQVAAGSFHSACLTNQKTTEPRMGRPHESQTDAFPVPQSFPIGAGQVYCWGSNQYGQCNEAPSLPASNAQVSAPHLVGGALTGVLVRDLASGWSHLLAVSVDRRVFTWGRGDYGQLGRGEEVSTRSYCHQPQEIPCLKGVKQVSCGAEHNIALLESGAVVTWGWNEHSICGTGDESDVHTPGAVPQLRDVCVRLIGCGGGYSFAVVKTASQVHSDTHDGGSGRRSMAK